MKKRLLAALMTLVMATSLIPTAAFADTTENGNSDDAKVTIDKTATNLVKEGEDYQTTVTLSVGSTEETIGSDVVFVLDKSTSTDVRKAALDMLGELKNRVDAGNTIKVGIVVFNKTASVQTDLIELTEASITDGGAIYKAIYQVPSSGTNIEAGIRAGIELLQADDDIADTNKHLVLVSDGVTYLWNGGTDGRTPYSIYTFNGEITVMASPSIEGTYLSDIDAITDLSDWYTSHAESIQQDIASYQHEYPGSTTYTTEDATAAGITYTTKGDGNSTAVDGGVYKTATAWKDAAELNYNLYAYAGQEQANNYPWAPVFIQNLGDIAGTSQAIPNNVSDMFDNVKDTILYEIQSGTVTDVIGNDFDWISMDTVTMTVDGQTVEGIVSGNTVTFGKYYFASYDDTARTLTWIINTPVETDKPVTLSYDLKLKDEKVAEVLDDPYTTTFETNEEATLDYVDPNGEEKEETFPVPKVGLSGKVSKPDMDKVIITEIDENGNKASASNASVAANETVTFELRSTIPEELAKSLHYNYTDDKVEISVGKDSNDNDLTYELTIHDVMNAALSLNDNSITVTVDGETVNSDYYTIASSPTDGCTFEITMDLLELYAAGIIEYSDLGVTDIVVSYTATLSGTDGTVSAGAYENTAWVTWEDNESERDTVEVITYGIKIFKYDQSTRATDSDGNSSYTGLSDAKFALYSDLDCTIPVKDSTEKAITLESGEDGYVTYEGLAAGTYYLKETDAPSGYVSSETPLTIEIPKDADAETYIAVLKFANAPIPSTGGAGTRMYLIGGACLIVAAGIVFVISRKKKDE